MNSNNVEPKYQKESLTSRKIKIDSSALENPLALKHFPNTTKANESKIKPLIRIKKPEENSDLKATTFSKFIFSCSCST